MLFCFNCCWFFLSLAKLLSHFLKKGSHLMENCVIWHISIDWLQPVAKSHIYLLSGDTSLRIFEFTQTKSYMLKILFLYFMVCFSCFLLFFFFLLPLKIFNAIGFIFDGACCLCWVSFVCFFYMFLKFVHSIIIIIRFCILLLSFFYVGNWQINMAIINNTFSSVHQ